MAGAVRTSEDTRRSGLALAPWALISGFAGISANIFLVLFYIVAKPWQQGNDVGWFGRVNDSLVVVQFAAMLLVMVALRQRMPTDRAAQVWTMVGVVSSACVVVLQILLLTGVLPFSVQVTPVTLCILVVVWAVGAISRAGARVNSLPVSVTRFGQLLALGLPAGALIFLLVMVFAWVVKLGSGTWVIGALPGFLVWLAFPIWAVLLSRIDARTRLRGRPDGTTRWAAP